MAMRLEMQEHIRIIRVQGHGPVETLERLLGPARIVQGLAEDFVANGKIWIE